MLQAKQTVQIAPSLLAADLGRLTEECQAVIAAGAERLHFDVMDFHYVPNLSLGPPVLSALRKAGINAPIDVHLMVQSVDRCLNAFIDAGASSLILHADTTQHLDRTLKHVKNAGLQVGLALNPAENLQVLDYVLHLLDVVLIMTVNPGFTGQAFIPEMLPKIRTLRQKIAPHQIQVMADGGLSLENCRSVFEAGVDILVFGQGIYQSSDYKSRISEIKSLCYSAET